MSPLGVNRAMIAEGDMLLVTFQADSWAKAKRLYNLIVDGDILDLEAVNLEASKCACGLFKLARSFERLDGKTHRKHTYCDTDPRSEA